MGVEATTGVLIIIVALVQARVDDTTMTAGLGLVGTGKSEEDFSVKQQNEN